MPFKCNKCNTEFDKKFNLERHLNRLISCNNIIKCKNCLQEFKTNQSLQRHIDKKNPCENINNKLITDINILKNRINELESQNLYITENKILKQENEIFKQDKIILNEKNEILKQELKNLKEENEKFKQQLKNIIGFIYIMTNLTYELQHIYKVGKTCNLKNRLATYNTSKIDKDKCQYVHSFEANNYHELEKYIHNHPEMNKYKMNGELYKINKEELIELLEKIKNEFENL